MIFHWNGLSWEYHSHVRGFGTETVSYGPASGMGWFTWWDDRFVNVNDSGDGFLIVVCPD